MWNRAALKSLLHFSRVTKAGFLGSNAPYMAKIAYCAQQQRSPWAVSHLPVEDAVCTVECLLLQCLCLTEPCSAGEISTVFSHAFLTVKAPSADSCCSKLVQISMSLYPTLAVLYSSAVSPVNGCSVLRIGRWRIALRTGSCSRRTLPWPQGPHARPNRWMHSRSAQMTLMWWQQSHSSSSGAIARYRPTPAVALPFRSYISNM